MESFLSSRERVGKLLRRSTAESVLCDVNSRPPVTRRCRVLLRTKLNSPALCKRQLVNLSLSDVSCYAITPHSRNPAADNALVRDSEVHVGSILFVPPNGIKSEWRKTTDLLDPVQRKLDGYHLCEVQWESKEESTISCGPNDGCEGEDCIFWTLSYTQIGSDVQDDVIRRFGDMPVDKEKSSVTLPPDYKPYKSLKLPKNLREGDVHATVQSQVIFCSCGTAATIEAIKEKHTSVGPPDGDPPK